MGNEGLELIVLMALQAAGLTLFLRDALDVLAKRLRWAKFVVSHKPIACDACMPVYSFAVVALVQYLVPAASPVLSALGGIGLAGIVIRQSPRPSSSQPPLVPPLE